jgi:methylmalonyl-CoA/ethylmalonyl-CoA epimerase
MTSSTKQKLSHIAIAVRDLEESCAFFRENFGWILGKIETVRSEQVRVAFLRAGDCPIELISPTGPESPVARFLEKRGEGLHHLALGVPNLSEAIGRLRERGIRPVSDQPRTGSEGCPIQFLHPRDTRGVLIELKEQV